MHMPRTFLTAFSLDSGRRGLRRERGRVGRGIHASCDAPRRGARSHDVQAASPDRGEGREPEPVSGRGWMAEQSVVRECSRRAQEILPLRLERRAGFAAERRCAAWYPRRALGCARLWSRTPAEHGRGVVRGWCRGRGGVSLRDRSRGPRRSCSANVRSLALERQGRGGRLGPRAEADVSPISARRADGQSHRRHRVSG